MSLLPPNASPLERACEAIVGDRIDAVPAPLRSLWAQAQTPDAWLPVQAWGLSVDEWDPIWAPSRQREVIAASIEVHRIKGTIGSVKRVLAAAGYSDATIVEGAGTWRYGDGSAYGPSILYGSESSWALYRVDIPRPMTEAQHQSVIRLLTATAPARCHLFTITYPHAVWTYGDGTQYGAATFYY